MFLDRVGHDYMIGLRNAQPFANANCFSGSFCSGKWQASSAMLATAPGMKENSQISR
jgi:hypothetical protein